MSKKRLDPVRQALPLVATLFVVVGIAAIVLTRPKGGEEAPELHVPAAPQTGPTTATVFQEGDVIRVTTMQGTSSTQRECPVPQGTALAVKADKNGVVIALTSGQNARIGLDCVASEATLPEGTLNPSASRGARLGEARSDGAGAVVLNDGKNEETVVLRGSNNRPFRDPLIVGWLDDQKLAVIAFQGDARHVLLVETPARVTRLAELPETATEFSAMDGAFWYVTVTPGPGIELGPRGPSEVRRIGTDGKEEIVGRAADDAIEALTPGPDGRFAFIAGGALFMGQADVKNIGTGRPEGWADDGTLFVLRNGHLVLVAPDGTATDSTVVVPDGVARVWHMTLDEPAAGR